MLEFCFSPVAAAIDWAVPPEFLDKELQEVVRDAAVGPQRVDKLIKVRLLDGTEEWILIHIEVQHHRDSHLPERVFDYHGPIRHRYGKKVLTLVILADEDPNWRPSYFEEEILGCRVRIDFPVCKLLDLVESAQS